MQLNIIIEPALNQLTEALEQLTGNEYAAACSRLNNSTIGSHTRHTIELFQCLLHGYESGIVNYDERKRDDLIETNITVACGLIKEILLAINKPDKPMVLQNKYTDEQDEPFLTNTCFYREVMYNLEHAIHHMALIRVGINEISTIKISENFGVAPSTLKYRKACAQ